MSVAGSSTGERARQSTRDERRQEDTRDARDKGPARPDHFYGERHKLEDWFNQLGLYFMFHETRDPQKTIFAVSFLRGQAQHYFKPVLTLYVWDRTDTIGVFSNYSNFQGYMRNVFSVSSERTQAVRII